MNTFLLGLFLVCAGTLMYEIVLTRLLSVISWYYLAFVSISMAMFGMTAGALSLHLRPDYFPRELILRRLAQCAMGVAISIPLALVTMLSIPIDLSRSLQTVFSFLLFSAVIAVPFFFSGIVVCISLTRSGYPMGRVYFTDLAGASFGCLASVIVMQAVDGPSAIFLISGVMFLSAAAYARHAGEGRMAARSLQGAALMLVVAALNACTLYGIQPIWSKGAIDRREHILAEVWNPISKVRVGIPTVKAPAMWGPSPHMPDVTAEEIYLNIDNDAATSITRFDGNLEPHRYLRYDVTSLAAQLRAGGSAAVIGVGGGRDVMNCAVNGFRRIVGIEVNSAIADLGSRRLENFSGFSKIPGFELHNDEGRSYLTRSGERFDLIQASLVDTWAATAAGAMTLSENGLYTVEGWKVFYEHLKPAGIITFSRWYSPTDGNQTYRLLAVAKAMMLAEGVADPRAQLAMIESSGIATLLASNRPFSAQDIEKLRAIAGEMAFTPLVMPDAPNSIPEIEAVFAASSLKELDALRNRGHLDYAPAYDASPFFFNSIHLKSLLRLSHAELRDANLRAVLFLFAFLIAASLLVISTIMLPVNLWAARAGGGPAPRAGGIVYFVAIGLGFMLAEMAMMQQLSLFLGHPIYSLIVVLAGLILSTGVELASDKWLLGSAWQSRAPALAAGLAVLLYSIIVLPVIHAFTAGLLWQRVLVSLALVTPCGFLMGYCFPVGMRWMNVLSQERNLPWMWALNGAAGTLGSFVAIVVSMDADIATCVLCAAGCYVLAGLALPAKEHAVLEIESPAAV